MDSLPYPLVQPQVDLSDFTYMGLDVRRLRDSKLSTAVTGDEFRAAVLLWCAAWHQVPAASLPDDDIELSNLAGYGRVIKEWRRVRVGALHGWVKCSDGRLYHPVVAEKAIEAWDSKCINLWNRECDRIRKENKRRKDGGQEELPLPPRPPQNSGKGVDGIPPDIRATSDGIPPENALKGSDLIGKDLYSEANASGASAPPDPIWGDGLRWLGASLGSTDTHRLRSYVGELVKRYGEGAVQQAFDQISELVPRADAKAYLIGILKRIKQNGEDSETSTEHRAALVEAAMRYLGPGAATP